MIPKDEQPYPLSEGWQWICLGDIATLFTGNSINKEVKAQKYRGRTDGLIYIATKDIGFDNQIDYETNIRIPESDNFKIAPANTPLLCIEGGSAGRKLGFTNQAVCFVNKLCAFVSKETNPKLIYYFLQTQNFAGQFVEKKHGLIGGVTVKNLEEIKFPLPPHDEQQCIVELLDELFSKLYEVKALAQGVVDSSAFRRAAILHKAFTGELTENWRDEHGTTLDSWENSLLGDVCNYGHNESIMPKDMERGKFLLDLEDIEKDSGKLIGRKFFDGTNAKSTKYIFRRGNVLYGKLRPYLNKVIIADEAGYCSSEIFPLDFGERILSLYAQAYLMSPNFIQYANRNSYGTNMPRLSVKAGRQAPFPVPPLDEQKEIVCLLDELLGREQKTKDLAGKTLDRVEIIKKSILTRAFRGELKIT